MAPPAMRKLVLRCAESPSVIMRMSVSTALRMRWRSKSEMMLSRYTMAGVVCSHMRMRMTCMPSPHTSRTMGETPRHDR